MSASELKDIAESLKIAGVTVVVESDIASWCLVVAILVLATLQISTLVAVIAR